MQRPHSEGRRPASHSQSGPSLVTRSLQFSPDDPRDRHQSRDRSQPRRPNTTPKPRIQRLLPSPGQTTASDWNTSQQLVSLLPSTLTRLPDSPPRILSLHSIEHGDTSKETPFVQDSDTTNNHTASSLISTTEGSPPKVDEDMPDAPANLISPDTGTPKDASPSLEFIVAGSNNEQNPGDSKSGECKSNTRTLEPQQKEKGEEHKRENSTEFGPLSTDIGENIDDKNVDDDEYKQALASRKQLLNDEENRQRIREELELYVGSLSSRTDENGEHLVEFPRNYQQIVSLMTQKDVSEEDTKSQEGQHTRQSWSRVLIESGLSKQQAFGILEDVDDDPEGSGSLAAKIALKMARIRQLDTILEEKLGKNLYANIVPKKQKSAQSSSQSSKTGSRTFVTQTQANTLVSNGGETNRSSTTSKQQSPPVDEFLPGAKKRNNFIERNKQVVANGMKANMTKDEEERLEKLLRDESAPTDDEDSPKPETEGASQECNEFIMPDDDKKAIDELLATKSGAYPLFAIDELQDGPTDEALLPSADSSGPVKDNIIQETKRERLQRRRLNRVEQELRFLKESPSVVIVGDDRDEDEHDDCRSEISYVTVASSTCSTRSGVISRHDFKCFLAQQKESYCSTPTASAEEIRRLLLTVNHGTSVSSNAVTAPTG